ncbi:expressed unknown protein [Seminavis robusta]|uniref:Uncharacterized protein n=1 Tax=Seminavis robusta TaxID=568900 RepID=A0A9N8F3H7_9STRA|nr:expressed unknown protein [Seminavis robusta]|eukprot:Sro3445_g348110.1 n/a (334) ;mRNA; f:2754-3858
MASISNNRFELHKRVSGKQVTTVYSGKWTIEEERYVSFLCQQFKDGALDIKEGTTLRSFLADKLGCKAKRITKKYERTGYNGKLQFTDKRNTLAPADLQWRRAKLQETQRKFVESREAIIMNELQGPQQDERSIMTGALFAGGAAAHRALDLREPRQNIGMGYHSALTSLDLPFPASLAAGASSALNAPRAVPNLHPHSGSDMMRASFLAAQAQPPMAANHRRLSFANEGLPSFAGPSLEALRAEEMVQRELRRTSMDSLIFRQEALLRARATMEMNALMRGSAAAASGSEGVNAAASLASANNTQTGVRMREEDLQTLARKRARVSGTGFRF